MEACSWHWIKNKKGNLPFSHNTDFFSLFKSHNSDFFSSVAWYKLSIASWKVRIVWL